MKYFDIELIDISDAVENFKFTKVPEKDLDKIVLDLRTKAEFIEFLALEGKVFFLANYFRGIIYTEHVSGYKNTLQENRESSVEVTKLDIKKKEKTNGRTS